MTRVSQYRRMFEKAGRRVTLERTVTNDGGPFLALQFPYAGADWQTLEGPDGSEFLEDGAFRLVLSVRRGAGTHAGRAWMDELAALFRGASFEGVQCFAPTSPVTDDRSEEAAYFRLSFSVPYQFIIMHQEA